jgi:hypothetical protein
VVRDLGWALASPHIISGDVATHEVDVFPDTDARAALAGSHAWLRELDQDPSHILRWVGSQRGANKLGTDTPPRALLCAIHSEPSLEGGA